MRPPQVWKASESIVLFEAFRLLSRLVLVKCLLDKLLRGVCQIGFSTAQSFPARFSRAFFAAGETASGCNKAKPG